MKNLVTAVALVIAVGTLGCSKGGAAAGGGAPNPETCQKAFEHWAEVAAKKGGTKEDKLKIQAGNIANCPKMMSAAGLKCLNDLTEADVNTWPMCLGKK